MKLSIEGYKSIASKKTLKFDGLTVLSGANSSGKSSFMQPLLILKQTIENHYDSGSLMLDGANVKLTDSSQVISKVDGYKKKSFSVALTGEDTQCEVLYKYKRGTGLLVDEITLDNNKTFKNGLRLQIGMSSQDISSQVPEEEFNFINEIYEKDGLKPKWKSKRNKCFISAELSAEGEKFSHIRAGIEPARELKKLVTRLIHVPGLRGNPERTYKIAASEDVYPGSFEKYVASIIHEWSKLKKHYKKFRELKEQLSDLGLASNIATSKINDTRVELRVSRFNNKENEDCVNIADVGFGVSQTLPVLTALLCAKKNQLVYIEQPELHLHPKAQFKLAAIITKAVNRGLKVVIETHSSILLRGLQIEVVKKLLPHEKISLNWFTQNTENGETEIASANLDELGAFGEWPEDFDNISLSVEQMYLDAVEESISEK